MRQNPKQYQSGQTSWLAVLALVIFLSILWLLWSGLFKPLLIGLGAFSVLLTTVLAIRMNFFAHTEGLPRMLLKLPAYWLWLLKEIVVSSAMVARIVLSPSLPLNPRVTVIKSEREQELPQVILGNSITLSPGTITIDIDEHEVIVHCINEDSARQLEEGELMRRIDKLEAR